MEEITRYYYYMLVLFYDARLRYLANISNDLNNGVNKSSWLTLLNHIFAKCL